ncbi:MAG: hypothetical protein QOG20_3692 [Pseudonocardiales bacterium]|nr:hypothetical protein [Pseudonocardiales bacterium]
MADEVQAIETAKKELSADPRFEYLHDIDAAVWQFTADCWVDRQTDHVPTFIDKNAREPTTEACYIPVEHLGIETATNLFGVRFLPAEDESVPPAGPWFPLDYSVGCLAVVNVTGTNHELMATRARAIATHALRVLRIALREHDEINGRQLRFRLSIAYAFNERISGLARREDAAYELVLDNTLINLTQSQLITAMPIQPSNDVEKKADVAARWIERACLIDEPLLALLYLFFALEALLGDKSEGLKAHGLAFRQTMLSHITTGGFTNPSETWFLYDQVRSSAVHGEDVAEVGWGTVQNFASVVRRALSQYLKLARDNNLTRRGRLMRAIDSHPDRAQLIFWLRSQGGAEWTKYLDRIEDTSSEIGRFSQ